MVWPRSKSLAPRGAAGAGTEQPNCERETTYGGGTCERRMRNLWWWEKGEAERMTDREKGECGDEDEAGKYGGK